MRAQVKSLAEFQRVEGEITGVPSALRPGLRAAWMRANVAWRGTPASRLTEMRHRYRSA